MTSAASAAIILCADDDPDDRLLLRDALDEVGFAHDLRFVEDGEQLMAYLRGEGDFADPAHSPAPDLLLLDLNMPRKDGREALKEIKSDPRLANIPVVVMSTSRDKEDIDEAYRLGANSFIPKPSRYEDLISTIGFITEYWFDTASLP